MRRSLNLDGFEQQIEPDKEYYIQDSRQIVGNCVLWWRPDGKGYTCEINNAGIYKGLNCSKLRLTDVPWPVDAVKCVVCHHVRMDDLREK